MSGRGRLLTLAAVLLAASSCGGDGGFTPGPPGPPAYTSVPKVQVSQPTSLTTTCDGVPADGTLYQGTAIEPSVATSPFNTSIIVATWQQNRWSTGGAQAIGIAASMDGGQTWTPASAPFSRCTGGSGTNLGDYTRASNPWVSISPNGVAWALSLSFTGEVLVPGSSSAMLISRSTDGGLSWSTPWALIADGQGYFNDKGTVTADPTNSNFVYVVWDRLTGADTGPSYFALTANAASTWQTARSIYDPGKNNQTIGNLIVVTPVDTLVNLFNEIDAASDGTQSSHLRAMRSSDNGTTWSTPSDVADMLAVGTTDPRNGETIRDSSLLFSSAVSPSGVIYVVWQDARFSGGKIDAIAMSQSTDDGVTWSAPVAVNGDLAAEAFTPTVAVNQGGTIAVTYYDLRNIDESASQLLADCWMVTSADGTTFTESHMSGSFDMHLAPKVTLGYFLGDYQSLLTAGAHFTPFYAEPNPGTRVSTDVSIAFPAQAAASAAAAQHAYHALSSTATALPAAASARMSARIHQALQARRAPG